MASGTAWRSVFISWSIVGMMRMPRAVSTTPRTRVMTMEVWTVCLTLSGFFAP